MRKSTLRRLEALENEERYRQEQLENAERYRQEREDAALENAQDAFFYIRTILLAYYVGGLKPQEAVLTGYARALNYQSTTPTESRDVLKDALSKGDPDLEKRIQEAELRLYAQVGIDANHASEDVLFDEVFKLANQLPEKWLDLIKRNNPMVDFVPGTVLPIIFSSDGPGHEILAYLRERFCR
jgi:hypothetical protein